MSASYHLILPMPAGRTGSNTGVMSVFFVPRLQEDGNLADWTRDWRNWPRVINGTAPGPPANPGASAPALELSVWIDNGTGFSRLPANSGLNVGSTGRWLTPAPSADAWNLTFGSGPNSIRVDRFRPSDRSGGARLAPLYDAGIVAKQLRDFNRALALQHPEGPPTVGDLESIAGYSDIVASGALDEYDQFMAPLGDGDVTGEETPEDADFHQAIAYVSAHPQLMRAMGLVVDLEVAIPPVGAGAFRLGVASNYEASYPLGKTVPVVINVGSDFWPLAVSGEGPGSWAKIGDNTHRVESLDIDAGIAALDGLFDSSDNAAPTSPAPLKTAGLYVTRTPDDLAAELGARWQEQAAFEEDVADHLEGNATGPVLADAEILVAGRRYDVFDETFNRWFSLWDREVPDGFVFPRNLGFALSPAAPDPDEGWMTYTAFTEMRATVSDPKGVPVDPPANPANPSDAPPFGPQPFKLTPAPPRIDETVIRVSPMIFSWRGWSLAANPPARGFSGIAGPVDLDKNEPTTGMPAKVIVDYEVPDGVLPRLRYTHRYKFRARVVDLAGNSRALEEAHVGEDLETPLIRFGRTNPIGAPVPIRREPRPVPGWGDTTTTMVIKSEFEQLDSTVVPTSRLLFPSQTDQFQCELHGYPTPDDALFRDPATFDMFVQRTATSVDAHTAPDAVTGELVSNPQGAWRPDVDYLVEPAAAGFALRDLPGQLSPIEAPLDTTWPNAHAIGFEIRAGDGAPVVTAPSSSGATVTAYVPKGVTRSVQASITVSPALAPHWAALQDLPAVAQNTLQGQVESGLHWMFSVAQPLELVHAVRRPLVIPAVLSSTLGAARELDSTLCSLSGIYDVDVKSTARIEVTGTWTDPVDVQGEVAVPTRKLLFTQQFDYEEKPAAPIDPTPFEIGDTKRHDVDLTLDAYSRYARYFTERTTVRFTSAGQTVALYPPPTPPARNRGIAEFNVAVTSGPVIASAGRDFIVDAATGTITHVATGALRLNVDVDVDFIRLPINRRSEESDPGRFSVIIPNTGVPAVPLVDEVLPAFDRERYEEGGTFGVYHQGQTIRVWLRRPWFLTGTGELLGVLVGDATNGPLNEVARDAMSPYGPDRPIVVDDFLNAVEFRRDLNDAASDPDADLLDVAGHEVQFDAASNRWFADISISTDLGYRPFVKLALVRFQPESVFGAWVSEPVITEPIRLGATRSASITRVGLDIELNVNGYQLGNRVTAQFQYADPDIADPDLRWTDIGVPVEVPAAPAEPFIDETRWTVRLAPPLEVRPVRLVIEDAERLTQQTAAGPEVVDSIAYIETIEVPADWTAAPPDPPGAPTGVSAASRHTAVTLTWIAPPDGGSPIQQYTIERREGSGDWGAPIPVTAPATTAVVGGLTNGTQYGFRVRAQNTAGPGPWSDEATATPAPTLPDQIGPVETTSGHRAALVRWPSPADSGSPITGLRIERREGTGVWGAGVDLAATSTRHIARGLTNGTSYEFRVRAINELGDGPWSSPVGVVPAPMRPAKVRRVVATTGGGLVRLQWRPAADRGAPLLRYAVERRPGTSGPWSVNLNVAATETELTVVDLPSGSDWQFRVRAENAVGPGDWSPEVAVTIESTGTVPDQVAGVVVEGDDRALEVTWVEPADGGSPVLTYTVERRLFGTLLWLTSVEVPGDQLVHRFEGLVNGTNHEVRVRAVNVLGAGPWSAVVSGSPAP